MFFSARNLHGYGSILRVLGSTTRDFLNNLDTLHDHLQVGTNKIKYQSEGRKGVMLFDCWIWEHSEGSWDPLLETFSTT